LTLLKKKLNYLHKKIAEKSTAEAADAGQDVKQDVKGGDAELVEDDDEKDLDVAEVLMLRREHFSPNLSLSFNPNPLCILKAKGAYLYTHDGRQYVSLQTHAAN
jgi:4-aminobutyrate aminotransferase-like enzyme